MGILDTLNARNNSSAGRSAANGSQQDRPVAQTWMNIGYEANGQFVNLPLGLAIDTMEPINIRGQNEEFVALQTARNELLKEIQELGDKLEPGAVLTLPLTIQIRRVNDKVVVDSESNPFSMANAGLKLVAAE
ncbi:hypothetical protein KIP58_21790 [Xanthomonas campestris pv. campestris]|uniref:Putative RNA polymerase I subunit A n=1 Tax=Agrobacterium phage OLIVR1 TaxID=2723769 RepID=A0A858MSD9_9CAUD|nr:hypothetical protein [Xanthomonas campestris]YP_010107060.1 putative RNA polymerase I subunit A [Agrobacterium phage OLIVR1]MCF8861620.1 hypothetical protein [Xanthomonas campestris pv. campestris]QIW87221.1 putative RNA polymerase I subunit A [Agrobacterium phage OLIVR1]